MKNNILPVISFLMLSILFSCSKKSTPHNTNESGTEKTTKTKVTKVKTPVPAVLVVNDAVAKKTIEGRYYYDLNGKRYYRNNKDGKYYLFNKAMYSNPDFDPQP
ncbi:MAG: hypothetical protein ABI402_20850 [Ferruginibacter sp.]